jgi:hypothetical protein
MPLSEETKTLIQKYKVTINYDDDSYLDLDTSLDPIEDGKYRLAMDIDGLITTDEKVIEVKDQKIVKNENLYSSMNYFMDSLDMLEEMEDDEIAQASGFFHKNNEEGELCIRFAFDWDNTTISELEEDIKELAEQREE